MESAREFGRLEAQVEDLKKDMAETQRDVKEILEVINQAKGSWKVMMAVAGLSAFVSGLVVKFFPFTWTLPK